MSVITINQQNFQSEVMQSKELVLIDFWASWCGPCRMLSPVVDEVAEELSDKVKVGKINVDEEPELAAKFGVMTIPTLVVMENGELANSSVGVVPKQKILQLLGV